MGNAHTTKNWVFADALGRKHLAQLTHCPATKERIAFLDGTQLWNDRREFRRGNEFPFSVNGQQGIIRMSKKRGKQSYNLRYGETLVPHSEPTWVQYCISHNGELPDPIYEEALFPRAQPHRPPRTECEVVEETEVALEPRLPLKAIAPPLEIVVTPTVATVAPSRSNPKPVLPDAAFFPSLPSLSLPLPPPSSLSETPRHLNNAHAQRHLPRLWSEERATLAPPPNPHLQHSRSEEPSSQIQPHKSHLKRSVSCDAEPPPKKHLHASWREQASQQHTTSRASVADLHTTAINRHQIHQRLGHSLPPQVHQPCHSQPVLSHEPIHQNQPKSMHTPRKREAPIVSEHLLKRQRTQLQPADHLTTQSSSNDLTTLLAAGRLTTQPSSNDLTTLLSVSVDVDVWDDVLCDVGSLVRSASELSLVPQSPSHAPLSDSRVPFSDRGHFDLRSSLPLLSCESPTPEQTSEVIPPSLYCDPTSDSFVTPTRPSVQRASDFFVASPRSGAVSPEQQPDFAFISSPPHTPGPGYSPPPFEASHFIDDDFGLMFGVDDSGRYQAPMEDEHLIGHDTSPFEPRLGGTYHSAVEADRNKQTTALAPLLPKLGARHGEMKAGRLPRMTSACDTSTEELPVWPTTFTISFT